MEPNYLQTIPFFQHYDDEIEQNRNTDSALLGAYRPDGRHHAVEGLMGLERRESSRPRLTKKRTHTRDLALCPASFSIAFPLKKELKQLRKDAGVKL
jgi:hypothetical protein